MERKLSRGLRNCNPGNIRRSKDNWQGLREKQTDPAFFQFVDMPHGYRALMRTLQSYRWKWKCDTIGHFIHRWAPSKENDTRAYIASVCRDMGVSSDYVPDVEDRETMCRFAAAISRVENGVPAVMSDVEAGWELL